MNRLLAHALIGALITAAAPQHGAAQLSAEPWLGPRTFSLSIDVGGAAFSDFRRAQARPVTPTPGVEDFERRVSARTSVGFGLSATHWIGHGWGVRLGGAYVPTRFSVWNEESAERVLDPYPLDDEPPAASLGVWLGNLTFAFRFPHSFGRVVPYGLIGGGVVHYRPGDDNALPPEARARFAAGSHTAGAAVFGIGATLPLQRNGLLLNFELTDHLARTPLDRTVAGEQFHLSGVPIEFTPDTEADASEGTGLTSHLRLTLGLTLSLVRP